MSVERTEAPTGTSSGQRVQDASGDRGNTFLEILISVALMGTIVVALLLAMQTSIILSRVSNDQAKVESVLGSAADRVANFAYSPCPGADGAEYLDIARAAAPAVGWTGLVVTIDEVSFWHPATPTEPEQWKTTNSLSDTECLPSVSMTDQRTLQKVRIRVTAPGGDYSRTIDVVKANFRPDEVRDQT